MSATTTTSRQQPAVSAVETRPVTFPRIVRAEWIKLWSLRSTYWVLGATVVAMVLMSLMMAFAASQAAGSPEFGPPVDGVIVIGLSYAMAQIVVAVLGVLIITGEYSTGMIRSSLAAVPSRLPVLAAKALVIAVVSFTVGVAGVGLSYLITAPMLSSAGGAADLTDAATLQVFWGTGLYLMGIALFGLGIGALLRHSAGAIAAVLGVVLLLPTIVQLLGTWLDWMVDAMPYLPTTAGERIILGDFGEMDVPGMAALDPWTGFGVFAIYFVVSLLAAAVLLRRRDA